MKIFSTNMERFDIPTLVKWAGGKKQLLGQLQELLPQKIERYFEPFVGGGAVAFYIIQKYNPKDILLSDINEVKLKVDTVIQNPPFGTKIKHADKAFLEKAMQIANSIYSIHKIESQQFIYKLASNYDFRIERVIEFDMLLKKTMAFHKRKHHKVDVACWHLKRNI